jgi:hypothetical protein
VVATPKGTITLKAGAAPKSRGASTTSRIAFAPPKAAAPTAAAMKAATVVGAAGQKGLSSMRIVKQQKAAKASSIVPASPKRDVTPSPPMHVSDDDRVKICLMLGVVTITSSSSSSESSTSEFAQTPQQNPDMAISSDVVIAWSSFR